ncbi:hypothetical protein [Azospirillum lipoferum]
MEDEARHILRAALTEERQPVTVLGEAIHRRFARLGGVEMTEARSELSPSPRKKAGSS